MCDERVQSLQTTLHPFATGVPILLLQGVEDINPTVVEGMVSVQRTEINFIMLFCCIYVAMGTKLYREMF
jgi:L-lactate permease